MRTFLTGITGFVGSYMADFLLEKGDEVYGLVRPRSPLDNIRHIVEDKFHLVHGDLEDYISIANALSAAKPEVIYHFAAQSFVPFSFNAPVKTLSANVIGTANLLEAIRAYSPKATIIIVSSSEVYGELTAKDIPVPETHRPKPVSPYGVSKLAEESLGFAYWKAYGLKTTMTRAFTHTGPRRGVVFASSGFASQIAHIAKGLASEVVCQGNLDSVRTYMDVRDAVRAYGMLADLGQPGEVYNIGGVETMSVRKMLALMMDIAISKGVLVKKMPVKELSDPSRPVDVTLQVPDSSKIQRATGWKVTIPFRETLGNLLDYWTERVAVKWSLKRR